MRINLNLGRVVKGSRPVGEVARDQTGTVTTYSHPYLTTAL